MGKGDFWKRPIVRGIEYGLKAMCFSYIPTIIMFLFQWGQTGKRPSFEYVFDEGNMISIWIPILSMALITLFEIGENRCRTQSEIFSFFSVIVLLVLSTAFYVFFRVGLISYAAWVKWVAIIMMGFLCALLCFMKCLESQVKGDVPSSRQRDLDMLDDRMEKIK